MSGMHLLALELGRKTRLARWVESADAPAELLTWDLTEAGGTDAHQWDSLSRRLSAEIRATPPSCIAWLAPRRSSFVAGLISFVEVIAYRSDTAVRQVAADPLVDFALGQAARKHGRMRGTLLRAKLLEVAHTAPAVAHAELSHALVASMVMMIRAEALGLPPPSAERRVRAAGRQKISA